MSVFVHSQPFVIELVNCYCIIACILRRIIDICLAVSDKLDKLVKNPCNKLEGHSLVVKMISAAH